MNRLQTTILGCNIEIEKKPIVCRPSWNFLSMPGCCALPVRCLSYYAGTYNAFGKYSDPLTFATFSYITALFKNVLNRFFPHQSTHNTP